MGFVGFDCEPEKATHRWFCIEFGASSDRDVFFFFFPPSFSLLLLLLSNNPNHTARTRTRTHVSGIIPAGSGNAMARSIQTPDAISATWNILKGQARPLDLMSVRQEGEKLLWSHLVFMSV